MKLRAGMILFRGNEKIQIIQRNCSRSKGMVKYKNLVSNKIVSCEPQKLEGFKGHAD